MVFCIFFFKQKTAYELRISDWSSDVCSSDLAHEAGQVIGTGALAADAVVGDEAADRHARAILQQRQHRGGDIAADVLDIDVDAVREGRRELRAIGRASCRERVCQYV